MLYAVVLSSTQKGNNLIGKGSEKVTARDELVALSEERVWELGLSSLDQRETVGGSAHHTI